MSETESMVEMPLDFLGEEEDKTANNIIRMLEEKKPSLVGKNNERNKGSRTLVRSRAGYSTCYTSR